MATKNAKLMEKKITKPTISKPSSVVLRKADKEMTKALSPYRSRIRWLESERSRIWVWKSPNQQYYNTAVYNFNKKRGKIDKEIEKVSKQMEKKKQEVQKTRANWKKLLKTTRA